MDDVVACNYDADGAACPTATAVQHAGVDEESGSGCTVPGCTSGKSGDATNHRRGTHGKTLPNRTVMIHSCGGAK